MIQTTNQYLVFQGFPLFLSYFGFALNICVFPEYALYNGKSKKSMVPVTNQLSFRNLFLFRQVSSLNPGLEFSTTAKLSFIVRRCCWMGPRPRPAWRCISSSMLVTWTGEKKCRGKRGDWMVYLICMHCIYIYIYIYLFIYLLIYLFIYVFYLFIYTFIHLLYRYR